MSLEMLKEEDQQDHQSIDHKENVNNDYSQNLINDNAHTNSPNIDQLNMNEQLLSLAFSDIISSNEFQFPISLSKDQLYDSFLLFQKVLKIYRMNKAENLHLSNSNKCVIQQNIITETTDFKEDDRRYTNTNVHEDNSRNNNITFNSYDTGMNNTANNNNQYKYSNNYDDKPIRPANADFKELVEKNLANEKKNNEPEIDKMNTHKKIVQGSRYIKKSLLKEKQEKKNKIYLDNIILNPNVNKDKSLDKPEKKEEDTESNDIIDIKKNNKTMSKQGSANEIIKPVIIKEDEDLVNQTVLFNNQNKPLILVNDRKCNSTNKQIKPMKAVAQIKVKTSKKLLQEKQIFDRYNHNNKEPKSKKTKNNSFNSNCNHNSINNNTIDKLSMNKNSKTPNKQYSANIQKRILSSSNKKDVPFKHIHNSNENKTEGNVNEQLMQKSIKLEQAINAKMEELSTELIYFRKEKERVQQLKEEYGKLHETLQDHTSQFNCRKIEFDEYKQEEEKKIDKERNLLVNDENKLKVLNQTIQLLQEIIKEDKIDIDILKKNVSSIQSDINQKDKIRKNTIDKLKKQLEELLIKHINFMTDIKCDFVRKNHKSNSNSHSNNTNTNHTPILNKTKKPLKVIQIKCKSNSSHNSKKSSVSNSLTINVDSSSNNKSSSLPIKQTPIYNSDTNNTQSHHPSTQFNTISHKSIDSIPIAIKDDQSELFDLVLPEKYHRINYSLLNEEKSCDGKVIRMYSNDKREIIFQSGVRKELYKEGYQIIYFTNGDIKQIFPEHKSVYYFKEARTVQTIFNDGLQVFKFANGQIEKHYLDGSKRIIYPNGSIRAISKEGNERLYLNKEERQ